MNVFEFELIAIPVHFAAHWIEVVIIRATNMTTGFGQLTWAHFVHMKVIDVKDKVIRVFDSL